MFRDKIREILELVLKAEETESYRARLLATYNYRGFAGNREYYKSRVKELRGVYGCKLERVKTPSDRIAITIIGQDYRTPPQDVITATQTAVDPVVNSGETVTIDYMLVNPAYTSVSAV